MCKTREDAVGYGQAAWNAVEENCNSHTKEARRANHEQLHNTEIKFVEDPVDFLYIIDGYCKYLEDIGPVSAR